MEPPARRLTIAWSPPGPLTCPWREAPGQRLPVVRSRGPGRKRSQRAGRLGPAP